MISKHNILAMGAVTFLVVAVLSASNPEIIQRNIEGNILNLIARSGDLMQSNPRVFSECLETYLTDMNVASDKFKKDHADCCRHADSERSIVESGCSASGNKFANRTKKSCGSITDCDNASSIKEMYECYIYGGNNNAKVSREVANEASFEITDYIQKMGIISSNENICTNKTMESYEYETFGMYNIFEDCCKGNSDKTSPSPAPTATPSETTPKY